VIVVVGGHKVDSSLTRGARSYTSICSRTMAGKEVEGKEEWFSESVVMWPGQRMSLKVKKILFRERSDLQDILVFESTSYGKVLVLDGVIQLTERDECAYQEMIAHVPLLVHPNPQRVLIVGGGDGGVLREVARHPSVREIFMCEIDSVVCSVARRFFGDTVATSFDDPRLILLHEDGAKFLEDTRDCFDVIIVDSSDPVGPAESLFEMKFFEKAAKRLEPENGVLCTQGECMWLHLDLIKSVMESCGNLFPSVNYAYTCVPTYPSGQIGFVISSKCPGVQLSMPCREISDELTASLKYYSPEVHQAAFVLPRFAERIVGPKRKQAKLTHSVQVGMISMLSILAFTAGLTTLIVKAHFVKT